MRITLVTYDPGHPLLAATTALLAPDHHVGTLHPETTPSPGGPLADVYLLKARTPRALALARALERRGARVINSAGATARCQDRTAMAECARRAGLPFAATETHPALDRLVARSFAGPVVVKSRYSRRHDLVARVDDAAGLRKLAAEWPTEPVVVQPYAPNSGWDRKLWMIGGRLFAALRRSELSPSARPAPPFGPADLSPELVDLARRVGVAFALDVYGVDVVETRDGVPLIVDVNAFPGARGQLGAPEALAELAVRRAEGAAGAR